MNKKQEKVFISITSKGYGAMWERGGKNLKGNGYSLVITDSHYEQKIAIATKADVCGRHALIPVKVGDLVIEVKHHRGEKYPSVNIWKIDKIDIDNKVAYLEIINNLYNNVWDFELTGAADLAVSIAIQKALTGACKQPCYCIVKVREKRVETK